MQLCRPDKALGSRVHSKTVHPRWSHKLELIRTYQAAQLGWCESAGRKRLKTMASDTEPSQNFVEVTDDPTFWKTYDLAK
jgi:hypothetical protein